MTDHDLRSMALALPAGGPKAQEWRAYLDEVVREYVASHDDYDELDEQDLELMFTLAYEREPDDQDRADGLWYLICVAVEAEEAEEEE